MSGLKRRFTPYTVEDKIPTNFQNFQVYFVYPTFLAISVIGMVWLPELVKGKVPGLLVNMAFYVLMLCWLKNWKMPGYYAILLLQIWSLARLPFSVMGDVAAGRNPKMVLFNTLILLFIYLGTMLYYWKRRILFVLSKQGGREALLVIRRAAAAPGGKTLVEAGILQVIGGGDNALEKSVQQAGEKAEREAAAPDGCDAADGKESGDAEAAGEVKRAEDAEDIKDGGDSRSVPSLEAGGGEEETP